MRASTRATLCLSLFVGGWIAAPATAQTDMSKFPLARAIPADAFLGIAKRGNPERQFLSEHWARVRKAFMNSGILEDTWDLISDAMEEDQAEKVDKIRERFTELCDKIEWGELFKKEMIHVGRYVVPFAGSPYEGLIMGRMDKERIAPNYRDLRAILIEIVKLAGEGAEAPFAITESEKDGLKKACLGPKEMPGVGIAVGCWNDVIIIAFGGTGIMDECVGLLRGDSKKERLIDTDRFKEAFSKLPPAEDSLVFFDTGSMMGKIKGMMQMAAERPHKKADPAKGKKDAPKAKRGKPAADEDEDDEADDDSPRTKVSVKPKKKAKTPPADSEDEEADEEEDEVGGGEKEIALVSQLIDDIGIVKTVASVEWTDGYRVFSDDVVILAPNASSSPIFRILDGGKPITNFERLIPKEATNFGISTGVNWVALYDYLTAFMKDRVPGGKRKVAEFDRLQKEDWELNVREEILAVFDGGFGHVSIGNDWVILLRVKDEKKACSLVSDLLKRLEEQMGKDGGLMMSPVKVAGGEGFMQVSHPIMMMMGGMSPPVWGCAEGHLMIGSSAKAIGTILSTAKGDHPNITENARWKKEAIAPPSGPLASISFVDESKSADEMQAAIGGISMALGMAGMFGQDMPAPIKSFLTKIPPMLSKLGPVVGKMDFFQSSAEFSTLKDGAWHTRKVQNYVGPRPADKEEDEIAPAKSPRAPKAAKAPRTPKPPKAPKPEPEDEDE